MADIHRSKHYLDVDGAVAVASFQDHYPNHAVLEASKEVRARGQGAYIKKREGGGGYKPSSRISSGDVLTIGD